MKIIDPLIGKALLISIADFFLIAASIVAGYVLLVNPLSISFISLVVIVSGLIVMSGLARVGSEIVTKKNMC